MDVRMRRSILGLTRRRRGLLRTVLADGLMLGVLCGVVYGFSVNFSIVRGCSMVPELEDGDRLVVDRLIPRLAGFHRFDVVILRAPKDPGVDYVKRIVGLPGDRVRLSRGKLWVNGTETEEPFLHVSDRRETREFDVPEGHYFVLGDNRPISSDSRDFGFVPEDRLKGTVRARVWPVNRLSLFR
jgi:signal peptidase I